MSSNHNDQPVDRILRIRDVLELTKISRTQLYRLIAKDEFPQQFKLTSGGKITGWLQSEVLAYIEERVSDSRHPATQGAER